MAPTTTAPAISCAQCGRSPGDARDLARWRPGPVVAEGAADELTAAMLLCPDCVEDDLRGDYVAGEVD